MGEWKAPISIRVGQALRAELEKLARRGKRNLGNISEVILGWGFSDV